MDPAIFKFIEDKGSPEDVKQTLFEKIENAILKYNTYSIKTMLNNVNLEAVVDDFYKEELLSVVDMTGPVIAYYETTYKEFELKIYHQYFGDLDFNYEDGGLRTSIYYIANINDNMLINMSININQNPELTATFYDQKTNDFFDITFDIKKKQGIQLALKMGVSAIKVGNKTKDIQEAYDELGG